MPLYEYHCDACDSDFELMRRVTDESQPTCVECGSGAVRRVVSQSSFVLKGSGWYVTDYGRKNSGNENHHGKGKTIPVETKSDGDGDKAASEGGDKSSTGGGAVEAKVTKAATP